MVLLLMDSERSSDTSLDDCCSLSEDDVSDVFPKSPRCSTATSTNPAPPRDFLFPFTPYDIQKEFMSHLYLALDEGKIGIFESPTGTGKSLSLICGAITWLRDFEERRKQELQDILDKSATLETTSDLDSTLNDTKPLVASTPTEPDWFLEFDEKKALTEKAEKIRQEQERCIKREQKLQEMKNDVRLRAQYKRKRKSTVDDPSIKPPADENDNTVKTEKVGLPLVTEEDENDENLVVEEYHSDEETAKYEVEEEEDATMEQEHVTKIYYCSRTHSQLSQFVHEIQKSPFGDDSKVVTLGSRQNLCVNEAVKKLSSLSLMNDRCLEMQKNKKKEPKKVDQTQPKKRAKVKEAGCPFYSATRFENFRDYVSLDVMDIEQLVHAGKEMKSCPYYGTRLAIPEAQVVVLPYNTLLHKSTRQACGIKLEGNIIIIDEAHNLTETIASMYSVEVTGSQFCRAHSQLTQYMDKFKSRLKAKNLMYIKQILQVLGRCIKALGGKTNAPPELQKLGPSNSKLYTINDFLFSTQMDNINMFKIQKYCEKSKISKKLNGYVEKYQPMVKSPEPAVDKTSAMTKFLHEISQKNSKQTKKDEVTIPETQEKDTYQPMNSPLQHIEAFLLALTNADKDGRVVIHKQDLLSQSSIKFLLLNPAVHFTEVIKEARSVIVAGGTMQPVDEFKHQLFSSAGVTPDRILEFSCGHVIPPENLLAIAMARGPSGLQMDFTFQSRDSPRMMDELGRILTNTSNVIPGGLVCFFPSYDYEKMVYSHWEKSGVITRLQNRKHIFREPRKASQVDHILAQYSTCIEKACSEGNTLSVNGAILLCVVGGKMSEGINFSDDLGRCIVMVGLPFANIKSPELKEKMDYLDATMPAINGRRPGQVHYENLCMKAVNQSIGRAIRHKGDYATILLVDYRYARQSIQSKLPGWIVQRLQTANRFGPAFSATSKFFVDKRSKVQN